MANPIPRTNLTFEEMVPYFEIKGDVRVYEGVSTNDFPANTRQTNVIQTDQAWYIRFHWDTKGLLNYLLAGTFKLKLYLEEMGGGEFSLPKNQVDVKFVSKPNHYVAYMSFRPGDVPAGVYKAVAAMTYEGPTGVPGPVAAFAEIGMLQFYAEGPTKP